MAETDVLLAVEATLTDEAREWWLRRAWEFYPRLRGAKVADVLEHMSSYDSFLPQMEAWFATHGDRLCMEPGATPEIGGSAFHMAAVATALSQDKDTYGITERVLRATAAGEHGVIDVPALEAGWPA